MIQNGHVFSAKVGLTKQGAIFRVFFVTVNHDQNLQSIAIFQISDQNNGYRMAQEIKNLPGIQYRTYKTCFWIRW